MTVPYAHKVASVSMVGSFRLVMNMYQGSVYKLIKFDLLLYLIMYGSIAAMYRFVFPNHMKPYFESFVMYCKTNYGLIPLTFVEAFYMSNVAQRWWETWKSIPWPDGLALKLNILFPNQPKRENECSRIKRTIMRYVNLSITETFRMISSPVKKRFPTYQHLVDAGLMTQVEMDAVMIAKQDSEFMNTFNWLPLKWAGNLLMKVEQDGMICRRYLLEILNEINSIRARNGDLLSYDWINVPIIYTQLVTIAVYSYFGCALFGRQSLDDSDGKIIPGYKNVGGIFDIIPLYLTLEFLFYVGWLKVAEVLINPYGEDDDDFETNYIIDRNLQICYHYIDGSGKNPPEITDDPNWEEGVPKEMPYTIASLPFRKSKLETGAENITIPLDQHQTITAEDIKNYQKRSSGRSVSSVSMRLQTAMGFNNIVNLVANPVIERSQRVSDSQIISSHDTKMKVSTISSPNLINRSTDFKIENETNVRRLNARNSKKKSFYSIMTRKRKEGLSEDSPENISSSDTLKKLSNLLWENDKSMEESSEVKSSTYLFPNVGENNNSEERKKSMNSQSFYSVEPSDDNKTNKSEIAHREDCRFAISVVDNNKNQNEQETSSEIIFPGATGIPTITKQCFSGQPIDKENLENIELEEENNDS